jgi:hypothetical protein
LPTGKVAERRDGRRDNYEEEFDIEHDVISLRTRKLS